MVSTGLLIISQPLSKICSKVGNYLIETGKCVSNVIYIKLEQNLATNCRFNREDLVKIVPSIYRLASRHTPRHDVRVILTDKTLFPLSHRPQMLLSNFLSIEENFWPKYLSSNFNLQLSNAKQLDDCDNDENCDEYDSIEEEKSYDYVALGGTFDGIHNGHKVLLNSAILRTRKELTIGVTDGTMVKSKTLKELIKSVDQRIAELREYLLDVDECIEYRLTPIRDMYGPTVEDEKLELLVVSEETSKGGQMVNAERVRRGMKEMEIFTVKIVDENLKESLNEENKASSSNLRMRRLGSLIANPREMPHLPKRPILIGLTGGITSGKSSICSILSQLGAGIINCDLLAHETYSTPESLAYQPLVNAFGEEILNPETKIIDRTRLGAIVFKNPAKLKLLNSIVWPATEKLVQQKLKELSTKYDVIVLEVALLLEANWDTKVHQVWVSIIPEDVAVKRLEERNKIDEDEAKRRIAAHMSNEERVKRANVVFSTLWEPNVTHQQVERAWNMLRQMYFSDESIPVANTNNISTTDV